MFKRLDVTLKNNPVCENSIDDIYDNDFRYYDLDGFELNIAEQKYYSKMKFPLDYPILNHKCWQEPWFELEDKDSNLILDHSMFLCRASYIGAAKEQLERLKLKQPLASFLINTKIKWGFDFALLAVKDNLIYEVLHIEYDSRCYETFCNKFINIEYTIRHTDWKNAADKIWKNKEKWQGLVGFEQNNWKSKFLIGWDKSEYTEKAI